MKALILAAGEGTRMRPLTANIPKPLLPVAGKPFLQHIIETLSALDIKDISLLIGWKMGRIKEHFGDGSKFHVKISYLYQEERMGTAHAVNIAQPDMDSPFLCLNGDIVVTPSYLRGILDIYKKKNGSIMSLASVQDPSRFGVVTLQDDKVGSVPLSARCGRRRLLSSDTGARCGLLRRLRGIRVCALPANGHRLCGRSPLASHCRVSAGEG